MVKLVEMGGCKTQRRGGWEHKTRAGIKLQRERPFAASDQLSAPISTTPRRAQGGEDGRDGGEDSALGRWR